MIPAARRRYSFDSYLRTGRLIAPDGVEHKFNHNHDPDNGRFTFAGSGEQEAADHPRSQSSGSRDHATQRPSFRRTQLTVEEYKQQAKDLWKEMEAAPHAGFSSDAAVAAAGKRVADAPASSNQDVEAPQDLRDAAVGIAHATRAARLSRGEAEKTVTFERRADGQIVIASMHVPGAQGGTVPGITARTIGVAHLHYRGLSVEPTQGDNSAVKFRSIPAFVMIAETGAVWEVGRQNGQYVQREIRQHGKVGRWVPYRRD